jgi:hypothetical protein
MLYWIGVIAGIFVGICLCIAIGFLFSGCTDVTSLDVPEPILLDVPLVYTQEGALFPGGWCLECSVVMVGAYYKHVSPTYTQVAETREQLKSKNIAIYFHNFWGLSARYRTWGISQINTWLQTEGPLIAYIDGWEDILHMVVIVGIDELYLYYLCPQLGHQAVSHERWNELHRVGEYGVWIIK